MPLKGQDVVDVLRSTGFREVADEAMSVLPDPVDFDNVAVFPRQRRGIFFDDLLSRIGGSP